MVGYAHGMIDKEGRGLQKFSRLSRDYAVPTAHLCGFERLDSHLPCASWRMASEIVLEFELAGLLAHTDHLLFPQLG